jgi:hypothetical protein
MRGPRSVGVVGKVCGYYRGPGPRAANRWHAAPASILRRAPSCGAAADKVGAVFLPIYKKRNITETPTSRPTAARRPLSRPAVTLARLGGRKKPEPPLASTSFPAATGRAEETGPPFAPYLAAQTIELLSPVKLLSPSARISMAPTKLHRVVDLLVRRAQGEGFVRTRDIRVEVVKAGLAEEDWENVVALAGAKLVYAKGRYYPAESTKPSPDRGRQRIERVAARLIRRYQATTAGEERRHASRIDFIQPIELLMEDGRALTVLSRDLSLTGVRFIASQSLLGQKVHVLLPDDDRGVAYHFLVRILWACAVGDGLFENGALFLDTFPRRTEGLRLVSED